MIKQTILGGLLVIACLLGIFAQPLAYYLAALFDLGRPFHYLTILTVNSYILLFFVIGMSIWKKYGLLLGVTCIVGGLVSIWSFFVLAMWWG